MQTLTEQLAVALEAMGSAISPDVYRKAAADLGRMEVAETAFRLARAALDRYRADPEALLRENGEAVRRLGNELMEGKGR